MYVSYQVLKIYRFDFIVDENFSSTKQNVSFTNLSYL